MIERFGHVSDRGFKSAHIGQLKSPSWTSWHHIFSNANNRNLGLRVLEHAATHTTHHHPDKRVAHQDENA